jgi:hypothetical protein
VPAERPETGVLGPAMPFIVKRFAVNPEFVARSSE